MLADRVRMKLLDVGAKPEDIADENCKVATDEDFSGTTNGSFRYIGTATRLVIPHVIKGVRVTSYTSMFSGSNVVEVRSNNSRVTSMQSMFRDCSSLTSLDVSSLNTSNVTDMSYMFRNYNSLTSLDLSNFDTSKVTNMNGMFRDSSATTLDLSSFDTSNVTDMAYMFYNSKDTTLDLSRFDTSKVTNMSNMFRGSSATTLDLSSFDTSNVTNMSSMFRYCSSVTTAYARTQEDADKFNTSINKPYNVNFVVKYDDNSGAPFSIQLRGGTNLSYLKNTSYGDGGGYVKYKINDGDYMEITDNDLPILSAGDIISFYLKQNWGMMSHVPRIYQDGLEIAFANIGEVTKEITLTEETLFEIEIVVWV